MKALPYLYFTVLKNRLKSFFRKPANWIVTLIMAVLLGIVVFAGGVDVRSAFRPIQELYAILSVLYTTLFAFIAYHGVNRGATLFSLADIQMLFPSPLAPKKILLYGLVKQMGSSLMVGLFLLFQYAWVHQQYGVPMTFLLLALVGYGLTLFLGQLTAMTLYCLTHGDDKKRKAAKAVLLMLCGFGALYVLLPVFANTSAFVRVGTERLSRLPVLLFPVGGWMRSLVEGIWEAQWPKAILGLGGALFLTIAGIVLLGRAKTDFYEDVLKATETLHQALAARREGKLQETLPANAKIGAQGINRGEGAAVFYYKHRLESRRARRFLLDTMTMVMLLVSLAFAFIMREQGVAPGVAFATYMQLFTVSTGRWVKELTRPYIYLVPETSFRKLTHCLRESMLKYVLEAVLLMVPMGLIFRLQAAEIAALVLLRISFSMLFVAGNLLMEKLFGGLKVKALVILLYFLIMILLVAPGAVLAIVLYSAGLALVSSTFTALCVLSAVNLILVPPLLFLCRNVLNDPEWGGAA